MSNVAYSGVFELLSKMPYYELIVSRIDETFVRLVLFTLGILIYSIFVWHFYRTLSKRDLFHLDLSRITGKFAIIRKFAEVITYVVKYTFVFPIYTFFWFIVFVIVLMTLSKALTMDEIFFVSLTIVATTRATAYYNENLSNDIAKMLPLALLAIFLVEPTFFSVELIMERANIFLVTGLKLFRFLVLVIALEWTLRITHQLFARGKRTLKREKAVQTEH